MDEKLVGTFEKAKKHNTWEEQSIQIGYECNQYLKNRTERIETHLAKVEVGQRRAGMSDL